MPNMKIYLDGRHAADLADPLAAALPGLRVLLCEQLAVDASACQIAVLPVLGLVDQPQINAELLILPRPDRTSEMLGRLATALRRHLMEATALSVAIRISLLDPETYVALK